MGMFDSSVGFKYELAAEVGQAFNTWVKLQAANAPGEMAADIMALTEAQVVAGVKAFAKAAQAHLHKGAVGIAVAKAMHGNAYDAAVLSAASMITALMSFSGAALKHDAVVTIKGDEAKVDSFANFVFSPKSVLAASFAVAESSGPVLYVEPVEGGQVFNDHSAGKATAGAATLAGLKAVKQQSYKSTPAVELAAELFEMAYQGKAAMDKAGKVQSNIKKQSAGYKGAELIFVESPAADLLNLADGFAMLAEMGELYPTYALDAKGRQYPVGGFTHFNSGVLDALAMNAEMAADTVKKSGLKAGPAVKAVKAALKSGDASDLKYFWAVEFGKTSKGKQLAKATFKAPALAAAVTLVALEA
jgi:hypothetical protein